MGWKAGQNFINKIIGCKYTDNSYKENQNNIEYVNFPQNSFFNVYKNHKNLPSGKWEHYIHVYDRYLSNIIKDGDPVKILEIGVNKGGSLEIWGEYLPKGSVIFGIDINKDCANLKFNNENIKVFIGSASDKNFVDKTFKEDYFDIIIDDGSHMCEDVIQSFELFFPKLNKGGLYIVEDTYASYWKKYHGEYNKKTSSIEYFKNIIDSLQFDHIRKFNYKVSQAKIDRLKKLNREIASVSFYDSILIIEKYLHKYRPMEECRIGSDDSNKDENIKYQQSQFERFYK